MIIRESQIRRMVRKCLREMVEDYPPMDYDYPEELDGIFADAAQEEDDFWRDYYEDQVADQEISRRKSEDEDWGNW